MKIGEKKTKEITINEVFTFLVEIERVCEKNTKEHRFFVGGHLNDYEKRRAYGITIENLGGESFYKKESVYGGMLKGVYNGFIKSAQHFIDSTSEIVEQELLDTFE